MIPLDPTQWVILRHTCGRQVSLERRVHGYVLICRQCAIVVPTHELIPAGPVVLLTPAVAMAGKA